MAIYDGLPLNTPTKVDENDLSEVWATRTANGGTVEYRTKPGTDLDRAQQLQARLVQAIATNSTFLALASPTQAQAVAQVTAITRQVQAMLRLAAGQLDGVN